MPQLCWAGCFGDGDLKDRMVVLETKDGSSEVRVTVLKKQEHSISQKWKTAEKASEFVQYLRPNLFGHFMDHVRSGKGWPACAFNMCLHANFQASG